MDWFFSRLSNLTVPSLDSLFKTAKPSLLYRIQSTRSSSDLLLLISNHSQSILPNDRALAYVTIQATYFLISSLSPIFNQLDNYANEHRSHIAHLNSRRIFLRESPLSQAELTQKTLDEIHHFRSALLQFIGYHIQTIHQLEIALASSHDLPNFFVAACKQAKQLGRIVSTFPNPHNLQEHLREHVARSVAPLDYSDNVAGKLGQFWNQNTPPNPFAESDARITLQMLEEQLRSLPTQQKRLQTMIDAHFLPVHDRRLRPVRYAGIALGAVYATRTLATTSRTLGGSGVLEDGIIFYTNALRTFANRNIAEPVSRLHGQIFRSAPVTASEESVAVAKSSLRLMLIDFTRKYLADVPGALDAAENGSMKAVMELIRRQAANPIRNTFAGNLTQAFLLQVQKLKCDVEELMLKSKQTLRAQELNLALVALVPSLISAALVLYMGSTLSYQWRSRGRQMIVSGGQTAIFLLGDMHSALLAIEARDDNRRSGKSDTEELLGGVQNLGRLHIKLLELRDLVSSGIACMGPEVSALFLKDLKVVASWETGYRRKRQLVDRMLISYAFINQQ